MKQKISLIGLVTIMVIAVSLYGNGAAIKNKSLDKKTFNILVINSYSKESKKDEMLGKLANYETINIDNTYNYKSNTEYLDVSLMNNESNKKKCAANIEYKYANKNIDFIFAISEEAFDVARELVNNKNGSLYKTPFFFVDVNRNKTLTEEEKTYITGVYTRSRTNQLLITINAIEDNIENINIILSESQSCYYSKKFLENNKDLYEGINLNIIQSKNINYICNEMESLNNDNKTVNIISGEFIDDNNSVVLPDDVIKAIKRCSDAPIYTNDIIYLNSGITGACILDFNHEIRFIKEELRSKIEGITENGVEPQLAESYRRFVDLRSIGRYVKHRQFENSDMKIEVYSGKLLDISLLWKTNENFRNTMIIIALSIIFIIVIFIFDRKEKWEKRNKEAIRKEKEKIKIDLIATLDHEIRTPLNIILNSTKLIKGNISDEEYIHSRIKNIDNNSYRLIRITNNILDITKIESGNLTLNKESVNIVETIEDVFQECIRFAKKKNIEIIFDTEEEEVFTVLDKERFQKAILNIISNAIKFSDHESKICGYVKIEDNNVVIYIKDSGIGIGDDKLSYIVEKFSQTADILTRENEGTGLGLYLTTKIIERHNGKILITSEANKGTLVQIILPIKNEELDVKCTSTMQTIKELAEIEMSDLI